MTHTTEDAGHPVLSAAQMRDLEGKAIDSGAVTGLELMERAGRGVVAALLDEWPDLAKGARHALVLCGPGNNGGDGFVIARLLREMGWAVTVCICGDPAKLPPDARVNYRRWCERGRVQPYEAGAILDAARAAKAAGADRWVVVDALFGIGQRAPLDDVLAPLNRLIDASFEGVAGPAPVFVSVDIPTGYDADTGEALARRPAPGDVIVTFHARKPLHDMPHLADTRCVVVDIGL